MEDEVYNMPRAALDPQHPPQRVLATCHPRIRRHMSATEPLPPPCLLARVPLSPEPSPPAWEGGHPRDAGVGEGGHPQGTGIGRGRGPIVRLPSAQSKPVTLGSRYASQVALKRRRCRPCRARASLSPAMQI